MSFQSTLYGEPLDQNDLSDNMLIRYQTKWRIATKAE
jgi:hypothetical protein